MNYFGTDGIRNKANTFTTEFLASIVEGLIDYSSSDIKIMLGGDTRESSEWILADLEKICESFGVQYANVGVLPTPAINYCFYKMGFDFAIDVTASHNSYTDNGIKIFERGENHGEKLSQKGCRLVEKSITANNPHQFASATLNENLHNDALDVYKEHLLSYIKKADFKNLKIAIDCADGATSVISSLIFDQLGATTTLIHANQNYNTTINHDCGSTHLESLQDTVTKNHLDFGIAFDGDGDRCLLIDENGEVVDGDQIIAIIANYLKLDKIAITVMANQGILNWAKDNNIQIEITSVGDSNVASAMKEKNIAIGGEQSGHIILPGEPTGDGMLTSLMLTKIIAETNNSLGKLAKIITKSPQIIVNMSATPKQKQALESKDESKKLLLEYDKVLKEINGRLLVRPSGTESLILITMWGDDEAKITSLAEELKTKLGDLL